MSAQSTDRNVVTFDDFGHQLVRDPVEGYGVWVVSIDGPAFSSADAGATCTSED